ncbi:glycosyltransferase family 39 protein [Isoptericola variabilis]|uniref:Glycosyltransferase RgtA/B/C/D-like domain-containing protein n=1 Tax=Isoptericola variabilis (strain 225) TaxID=743718 RepID=F6FS24_ISOV2|nr:glycosyltransferase family 39 protein [Isoptericola variabilis]AEG45121.1 hypothetical protein Isova_2408 [Isoptericola variabilis 225]TWH32237.1 4-amino-4-deoxy-L-arabinose transferase and related glycosyltransferases of PMT family [Isoptericola variabilis J7]
MRHAPGAPHGTAPGRAGGLGRLVGGRAFLSLVIAAFVVQGAWIALLARPSIYDEAYHIAAVRAFARAWTPFVDQAALGYPRGVGDVERYGSYLMHWLLSYPYRVTGGWDEGDRVVMLRLLCVAAVAGGLLVWRAVFRRLGAGPAGANVAVLVVSLAPLLVFQSANVNYDNLLFLLTAVFCLAALRLHAAQHLDLAAWASVLLAGGLLAVTKYSALPFIAFVGVVLLVRQVRSALQGGTAGAATRWLDGARRDRVARTATAGGAVLAVLLVVERYGMNVVRYGTPVPDCGDVHPADTCATWEPWGRNQTADASFADLPLTPNLVESFLTGIWVPRVLWTWNAIGVKTAAGPSADTNGPTIAGFVVLGGAIALLAVLLLTLVGRHWEGGAMMLLGGTAAFGLALFLNNLDDYRTMGQPIGVHGRYLVTFVPVLVGIAVVGAARMTGGGGSRAAAAAVLTLVVATQGGGAAPFLTQSTAEWWQDKPVLVAVQERLASVARGLVPHDDAVRDPRPDPGAWSSPALSG